MKKIQKAVIVPSNRATGQWQAEVHATFEDDSTEVVLRYYDDELRFTESEFIGLTQAEVTSLFHKKDVAYLIS